MLDSDEKAPYWIADYVLSDEEFVGKFPVRQDIEVLPADDHCFHHKDEKGRHYKKSECPDPECQVRYVMRR